MSFGGITPAAKSTDITILSETIYGVKKDGFTYIFSGNEDTVNKKTLGEIAKSFLIIEPTKPIKCLWTGEFLQVDFDKLNINKAQLQTVKGYYYKSNQNTCLKTEIEIRKTDSPESVNIPFISNQDCLSTCTQ